MTRLLASLGASTLLVFTPLAASLPHITHTTGGLLAGCAVAMLVSQAATVGLWLLWPWLVGPAEESDPFDEITAILSDTQYPIPLPVLAGKR